MNVLRSLRHWNQVAGTVCLGLGVASILACAVGVRNAPEIVEDLSYLVSGGIGGLFLLGLGVTLRSDRHLEQRREELQHLEGDIRAGSIMLPEAPAPPVNLGSVAPRLTPHAWGRNPATATRTGA